MNKRSFEDQVLATMREEHMTSAGNAVLVGVSGGADSMALLYCLLELRESLGLGLVAAAHVHHGLRGEEADRDEDFVRAQCDKLEVPLFVCKTDVAALAAVRKRGLEETGRQVRYAFFEETAAFLGGARVATAHTLSDTMETVLLHMARGCSLSGLTGIPPVRGNVIRPLINCSRTEVEAYCAEQSIPFVQDSTNEDVLFARNRVRNCIVKELYALNPRSDEAFQRLTRAVRRDESYLQEETDRLWEKALQAEIPLCLRLDVLRDTHECLQYRLLLKAVGQLKHEDIEQKHMDALHALIDHAGAVSLPGTVRAVSDDNHITFTLSESRIDSPVFDFPLKINGTHEICGTLYSIFLLTLEEYENCKKIHKILLKNTFDYDNISGILRVRNRMPGDAYHPVGRQGGKTLKKLFNEAKLSSAVRSAMPIVCDDSGIVLVPGFGCDERLKITADTKHIAVFGEKSAIERLHLGEGDG